jgi:hypothetical protein
MATLAHKEAGALWQRRPVGNESRENKMKKMVATTVVLMALTTNALAAWVKVKTVETGSKGTSYTLYADPASIDKRDGGRIVAMNFLYDYQGPGSADSIEAGRLSRIGFTSFDCKHKLSFQYQFLYHRKQMVPDSLTQSFGGDPYSRADATMALEWNLGAENAKPADDELLKLACGKWVAPPVAKTPAISSTDSIKYDEDQFGSWYAILPSVKRYGHAIKVWVVHDLNAKSFGRSIRGNPIKSTKSLIVVYCGKWESEADEVNKSIATKYYYDLVKMGLSEQLGGGEVLTTDKSESIANSQDVGVLEYHARGASHLLSDRGWEGLCRLHKTATSKK